MFKPFLNFVQVTCLRLHRKPAKIILRDQKNLYESPLKLFYSLEILSFAGGIRRVVDRVPARRLHGSSVVDDGRTEAGTVAEDVVFLHGHAVAHAQRVVTGAVFRTGLEPGPGHFLVMLRSVVFFNEYQHRDESLCLVLKSPCVKMSPSFYILVTF